MAGQAAEQRPPEELTLDEQEQQERDLYEQMVADDHDLDDPPPAEPELRPKDEGEEEEAEDEGDEQPAKEEAQAEGEGEGDEQQKPPTGLEWLDDLPEEKRAAAENILQLQAQENARLQQRVASHLGQLRPAQQAIAKLQRKVNELQKSGAQHSAGDINAETFKKRLDAHMEWIDKEYSEFPEEAAKLKAQAKEFSDGLAQVLESVPRQQPATQQQYGLDRTTEIQHLSTAYSDWGERRYSAEFQEWINRQPPDVAGLLNSPYASDNIALLDRFTQDNPEWTPPQRPEDFASYAQAQHSYLFRGWAEAVGFNPDTPPHVLPDHQRDFIMHRFRTELGEALSGGEDDGRDEQDDSGVTRLAKRRKAQLQDRDPGTRRTGIRPGQKIDLETEDGQRAYYEQLVASDPDLK